MEENIEVKSISVSEFPERSLPYEFFNDICKDTSLATVNVVAKKGTIGDWTVYCGWPEIHHVKNEFQRKPETKYYCSCVHEVEDVIIRGDKLSYSVAKYLFPEWDKKYTYRL